MIMVLKYTNGEYEEGSDWETVNNIIIDDDTLKEVLEKIDHYDIYTYNDEDGDGEEHEITIEELKEKVSSKYEEIRNEYHY